MCFAKSSYLLNCFELAITVIPDPKLKEERGESRREESDYLPGRSTSSLHRSNHGGYAKHW